MPDEKQGFKVVDKRGDDGVDPPSGTTGAESAAGPDAGQESLPEIDFITFILSLSSSAMVHLGRTPHPDQGGCCANLPLARQTIDILGMLQEKTAGNLSGEEERILSSLLTELRLAFVDCAGKK